MLAICAGVSNRSSICSSPEPPTGRRRISGDGLAAVGGSLFDLIRLDIHLRAGDEIYVTGMGLESEWQADIQLKGTTLDPRVTGQVELVRGTLGFAGRSFDLEEGKITFPTGDAYDPALQLVASDTFDNVTVSVNVSGRASNPQVTFSSVPGLPETLSAAGVPAVALASIKLPGFGGIVVSEERTAARDVARYLIGLGHRRFALLNGPAVAHAAQERRTGFIEVLEAEGLSVLAEAEGNYEFESGFVGMQALLSGPVKPSAVFVTNDVMAAGAMKAAAAAGLSVPRDVSIVGFDDSILARMLTPALTTVHRPIRRMASRATACLIGLIEGAATQREFFEDLSLTLGGSAAPPAE